MSTFAGRLSIELTNFSSKLICSAKNLYILSKISKY